VAALVTLTAIGVAVLAVHPGAPRAATSASTSRRPAPAGKTSAAKSPAGKVPAAKPATGESPAGMSSPGTSSPGIKKAYVTPGPAGRDNAPVAAPAGPVSLLLTAAERKKCPAAATACADLTRHISWLQTDGTVSFGPVQMEPGQPGGKHATPRGTFHVSWKAGPGYVSDIYHEAMPWATFFAAGGIAFHGGGLTAWSHGCVHLTVANAHYYNEHLPVGAEVVVFQ
jgi:lipoprotein-anchoring transpeptidase ErfK/SrfK